LTLGLDIIFSEVEIHTIQYIDCLTSFNFWGKSRKCGKDWIQSLYNVEGWDMHSKDTSRFDVQDFTRRTSKDMWRRGTFSISSFDSINWHLKVRFFPLQFDFPLSVFQFLVKLYFSDWCSFCPEWK